MRSGMEPENRELFIRFYFLEQTVEEIAAVPGRTALRKRRNPFFAVVIADVICALSIRALAAGRYVAGGGLAGLFGFTAGQEETTDGGEDRTEPAVPAAETAPVGQTRNAGGQQDNREETSPQLDGQIAEALHIDRSRARQLLPAVQDVDVTSPEAEGVGITVLQTLGDAFALYIKLRVEFPEEVELAEDLDFETISFALDPELTSWQMTQRLLEREEHALTYRCQSACSSL